MANKWVWVNATIAFDLPEDTPTPPKDWEEYDKWYQKWVEPAKQGLYDLKNADIDVHEEQYEI